MRGIPSLAKQLSASSEEAFSKEPFIYPNNCYIIYLFTILYIYLIIRLFIHLHI